MIVFSLLTCYMMIATIYSLVRSFQSEQTSGVYAQLIISIASTYGVYLLSSLIALDPWHMCVHLMLCLKLEHDCADTGESGSLACCSTCCVQASGQTCASIADLGAST